MAGTPWLFARQQLDGKLDALFIDKAGQMSLANAVAMAGGARNLILLGDPQQLARPSKGAHPAGAGASALGHVIGEHSTMPPDRGLFLATTWRMRPEICSYVSEVADIQRQQLQRLQLAKAAALQPGSLTAKTTPRTRALLQQRQDATRSSGSTTLRRLSGRGVTHGQLDLRIRTLRHIVA
ncbi:MAG: hypothetical protein ACRDHX_05110 [Chloroflexota bacterium]